jgi:hypothetical protein
MKKTRSVAKAIESAKTIPHVALADEEENRVPVESNLSPERMMEGASATTELLSQMLAQREGLHQLRDWGINE